MIRIRQLIAIGLLLCLTGCKSGIYPADEAKKTTEAADTITLSVLAGQSTSDAGIEDMISEVVEAKFPGVRLEWECVDWGDDFREGLVDYSGNETMIRCLKRTELIKNNSWKDAMMIDQHECDSRFASSQAAMYLTGSWSLQFANQYENPEQFGIFPYPNGDGEAMLIRETNMTFMKSSTTKYADLIDKIFYELVTNEKLVNEILDFTQTYSVLPEIETGGQSLIEEDVAHYEQEECVVEVTTGNNQLIWSFQNEVAVRQLEWLKGNITLEEVLSFADSHRQESSS